MHNTQDNFTLRMRRQVSKDILETVMPQAGVLLLRLCHCQWLHGMILHIWYIYCIFWYFVAYFAYLVYFAYITNVGCFCIYCIFGIFFAYTAYVSKCLYVFAYVAYLVYFLHIVQIHMQASISLKILRPEADLASTRPKPS
jgi:hypothetical protein